VVSEPNAPDFISRPSGTLARYGQPGELPEFVAGTPKADNSKHAEGTVNKRQANGFLEYRP